MNMNGTRLQLAEELPGLMRLARTVSMDSDCLHHLGAIIVNKGRPISTGFNKNRTHPKYKTHTIHAEMVAIDKLIKTMGEDSLKGTTILIYREKKKKAGKRQPLFPALAKPCEYCQKRIEEVGIETIIYTTDVYPYFEIEKLG